MAIVNPHLARFAAEISEAYDGVSERFPYEFFEAFAPLDLRLYTVDGLTVRFLEEGLEFYPKEENE